MAGETIREVVIKARMELERATSAPLEDVKRKAVEASAAVMRIGESADKAGAAMRGMPDMLRMPRSASGAENVKSPIVQARGGDGASLHEAGRSLRTGSVNFKEAVEKFRGAVGGIIAGVAMIANARQVHQFGIDQTKKIGRNLAGEDDMSDLFAGWGEAFGELKRGALSFLADLSEIEADVWRKAGAGSLEKWALGAARDQRAAARGTPEEAAARAARIRERTDSATLIVLQEQMQKAEALKAIYDRQHETRVAQLRKEQSVVEEAVEKLKDRIDTGREAFGMLNFDERESLKAIVDKVAGGGLGALRPDELDRFRSNPALAGLVKEQAAANADASGFEDILRKLGLDRRLAQEETKLKATIEQINQITISSDPAKLVEDLRKKLEPFFERVNREALEKLTKEFEKQVARARANLP